MRFVSGICLTVVMLSAGFSAAGAGDLRTGAIAGARMVDIRGQLGANPAFGLAGAIVFEETLAPVVSVGIEPGLAQAGSDKYPLLYANLPLIARMRWSTSPSSYIRATVGTRASYLIHAKVKVTSDDDPVYRDVTDDFRRWELAAVVGVGFERHGYLLDLRYSRSLLTIDAGDLPLFAVNQELGVWIGVAR